MGTTFIRVGFGNVVAANRVIGMVGAKSAPVRRMILDAASAGTLITLSGGRRSKAAIIIDTGHIVLAALDTTTIASRITNGGPHADS